MNPSRAVAVILSAALLMMSATSAAEPGVEQRLADLEAYVRNSAPSGPLQGLPGPGHNG